MNFSNIKIIIWDLDDTFWKGTLSEGGISPIEENIKLVKDSSVHGVINSICSKNDKEITMSKLSDLGIDDYFVFPSIDWTPKGLRIKKMLKDMGLRPANTLFIDDNIQNLNEAKHYLEELMISTPEIINELIAYYSSIPESDKNLKRLNQYKLLERKSKAKDEFSTNEEFLYNCNLRGEMNEDCLEQLDRIAELVQRSNQLNYTKRRDDKEDIKKLITDSNIRTGVVTVKDNFGDYGMVGFYAIDKIKNECIHFLFSCRTIGQGVEQYVYSKLGYPKLNVVGKVISMVDNSEAPKWINQLKEETFQKKEISQSDFSILFKGPCDLQILTKYIQGKCKIDEEFTYIGSKNNVISGFNHSVSLCGLLDYSDEDKNTLINDCVFMDKDYFKSTLFSKEYDVIFLSSVLEPNLGIYRKKGTDLYVPFGEAKHPLTDPDMQKGILAGDYDNSQNAFTQEFFDDFCSKYDFVGRSTPETYVERLRRILTALPSKTKVCIVMGSELKDEKENRDHMVGREILHGEFNTALRKLAKEYEGKIFLLDVNKVIKKQGDYDGNINHFSLKVYYLLAQMVITMLNEITCHDVLQSKSKIEVLKLNLFSWFKSTVKGLLPHNSSIYKNMRNFYRIINKRRGRNTPRQISNIYLLQPNDGTKLSYNHYKHLKAS